MIWLLDIMDEELVISHKKEVKASQSSKIKIMEHEDIEGMD